MMTGSRTAYLLLTLTTLFWGGNTVAAKLGAGHISPMLLNSARWTIAFAILFALYRRHLVADWPVVRRNLVILALLGTVGFTLFTVALYSALTYTSAINVSIEQGSMPMLIFLLNFLIFGLKASTRQLAGLAISIVGVVLVASHGEPARLVALDINVGDGIAILASIFYAAYSVALRFKPAIGWQSLAITLSAFGALSSLPFTAVEWHTGRLIPPDTIGWAVTLYVVVFPSILAQMFFIRGVELIGANRAGLFINLVPVFGTILAIALAGETLHLYHVVAMALTLGGIALAEWRRRDVPS